MIRLIFHYLRSLYHYVQITHDPISYARSLGVEIGEDCRLIGLQPGTFGTEPYLIKIGAHVTITSGVKFITHDGGVWVFRKEYPHIDVIAPITVGNNVFVGLNTILLPGVTVGNDCVIGAGSVVVNDIPSRTVAAGVPARPIKTIDEYRGSVNSAALYIRDLPKVDKRARLEDLFATE